MVRGFLEEVLPALSPGWWADLVVPNLSFQQRRAVETRRITALAGLDLAALLRIEGFRIIKEGHGEIDKHG